MKRFLKWTGIAVLSIVVLGAGTLAVAYWRSDNDCAARAATSPANPMKGVVRCEYGSPDVLRVENLEKPVPKPNQVLVRVRAASVNPLDYHYMRGTPMVMRMETGLRKPKDIRLGVDFAGVVEAVGADVKDFKPGDAVMGGGWGSLAEYVVTSEKSVVAKPENISFEEAAGVRVAALTALQALRDKGNVQPGQRVLINGASGGVGTFAVQIGKALGAHVTAVCSTRNVDLVRSLGADEVIDYTKHDYTRGNRPYDVIVDNVGNHPLTAHKRILAPKGIYVMVSGPKGRWIAPMDRFVQARFVSRAEGQQFVGMMAQTRRADLEMLRELLATGKIRTVVDRRYPLNEAPEAVRYLETGRARGKVIVTVGDAS